LRRHIVPAGTGLDDREKRPLIPRQAECPAQGLFVMESENSPNLRAIRCFRAPTLHYGMCPLRQNYKRCVCAHSPDRGRGGHEIFSAGIPQLGLRGVQPGPEKGSAFLFCLPAIPSSGPFIRHFEALQFGLSVSFLGCLVLAYGLGLIRLSRRHPPCSLGMNSVSCAVGLNFRISSGPRPLSYPLKIGVVFDRLLIARRRVS
jgi:hypothetical protein